MLIFIIARLNVGQLSLYVDRDFKKKKPEDSSPAFFNLEFRMASLEFTLSIHFSRLTFDVSRLTFDVSRLTFDVSRFTSHDFDSCRGNLKSKIRNLKSISRFHHTYKRTRIIKRQSQITQVNYIITSHICHYISR